MAKSPQKNGDRLDEAMALLINNQAAFVSQHAQIERELSQLRRETREDVGRIEKQMAEIIRAISEHNRIIEYLTEAVRDKFGFQPPPAKPPE